MTASTAEEEAAFCEVQVSFLGFWLSLHFRFSQTYKRCSGGRARVGRAVTASVGKAAIAKSSFETQPVSRVAIVSIRSFGVVRVSVSVSVNSVK